jgi:hypothetical protein
MKKILFTLLFALSILSVKAQQDAVYGNIFFNSLYPNAVNGNPSEQTHYHISNTGGGTGGAPLLDVKWWGGINMHSEGGAVKLKSSYGTFYISQGGNFGINTENPSSTLDVRGSFRVESNGNFFGFNGGPDLILKAPSRTSNTTSGFRALVHDEGDILTINYGGDYIGGTKIATNTIIKNNGDAAFQGKLEAREVKVTQSPTADFVFEENYGLPKLEDVEKHIKEKKHLPEIASAKEMEKEGVNIGEFQIKLLQKIEELTLYTIEQNKQIKELKKENENLKQESLQIKTLLERVEKLEKKENAK